MAFKVMKGDALNAISGIAEHFPHCTSSGEFNPNRSYFCAFSEGELCALIPFTAFEHNIHVEMVETATNKRHMGVAKSLINAFVDYSQGEGLVITTQGYLPDGKSFLSREVDRLMAEHPGAIEFVRGS